MKRVGIGVIGCGARVRQVLTLLLQRTAGAQILAIHDPSPQSLEAAREALGGAFESMSSANDVVRHPLVDWIVIGSWNSRHAEHAILAMNAGKHVFCEKPLATTVEDCAQLYHAYQSARRIFSVGFVLRYSPHYLRIAELLHQGAVGRIVSLEFNETLNFNHGGFFLSDWRRMRKNGGPALLEKCCHDVDLVNWMVGSRARRVASFAGLNFFKAENASHMARLGHDAEGRQAYRTWPSTTGLDPFHAEKDIEDNQVAIIEFENDVRATFHLNCNAGLPERRMYICGTEGTIRADVLTGKIEVARIGFNEKIQDHSTHVSGSHGGSDEHLAEELGQTMTSGRAPRAGLVDGLNSAVTCLGIDRAMLEGRVLDMNALWSQVKI